MKYIKWKQSKAALLALACGALLTPATHAVTITAGYGDLILGFQTTDVSIPNDLEVDLGPISNFYNTGPQEIHLNGLAVADLAAVFGANWATRADVFWGAVASASSTGTLGFPGNTLWSTTPDCLTAPANTTASGQGAGRVAINAMYSALNGKTANGSTAVSITVPVGSTGSWTGQEGGNGFTMGWTVQNFEGDPVVVSQLYELRPAPAVGQETEGVYIGDLILRASGPNAGLNFRAAQPTLAVCKNLTVSAGPGCNATVTAADVDNGSTGYCLALSIDATGPLPIGQTNVTLTVTDGYGSNSTCVASVTVTAAAPTLSNPGTITQCAPVVTYPLPVVTSGNCGSPSAVSCVPTNGSTFASGNTTVTCQSIASGVTGTVSFVVNISGSNPTVTCQGPLVTNVVNASDTSIVINYPTPAGNGCATPVNVVCVPASGSTFNVGTTNVTCTATDANNHTGSCSFAVTVNGAGIGGIIPQVTGLTDPKMTSGRKNSMIGSLTRAQADLNKNKPSSVRQACGQLKAFILRAQIYARLHIITQAEADALIAAANAEKVAIGCP